MKTVKTVALTLLLLVGMVFGITVVHAQAPMSDPAMQRARQETQVVLDLGRLIGFVDRMDAEQPGLRLSREQARELVALMGEIRTTARLTPALAEAMMVRIEDDILTPAQLLHTDRFWIQSERSAAGTGTGAPRSGAGTPGSAGGSQSGRQGSADTRTNGTAGTAEPAEGSLASYIAGGPYNPLADTDRPRGREFETFYQRLRERSR
jgi:hypothetical protein